MNFKALHMLFFFHKKACQKTLLVTKLTTILIIAACMHVSAKGFGQKINIEGKDMPLEKVFSQIEKQVGYVFFFNYDLLQDSKKVTVNIKDANIEEAMVTCLKDQPLEFKILDRTITITKKKALKENISAAYTSGIQDVRGFVRTENGDPLSGATVTIKSIKKLSLTNASGEFVMHSVPNGTYWVEISFVGYENKKTQIVVFDNTYQLFAELKQSTSTLDETQVIAYGTTTKRFSTGNIATVKGDDIAKQPVDNPLLALEGRVPGLFITQSSGLAGAGVTVRIQGQNSILNGSDPLFVIDGVPYTSQLPSTYIDGILGSSGGLYKGSPVGAGNPLNYINPNDIENIEILKDADATAIYGSRAANGAILITTRRGKVGQTKVEINLQQGQGKVTRKINMLNTQQYLGMRHEALNNDGLTPDPSYDYDLLLWDTTRYTDWQKTLIGGTSQYTNISANVSGGTTATQYLIGGTWHRETTVFPSNFADQKGSVHFSINSSSVNQKFHVLFSGNYLVDNNLLPNQDLTAAAIQLQPDAPPLLNKDGSINWAPDAYGNSSFGNNPIQYSYNIYKNLTNNLISQALLNYKLLPSFEIRSNFGYTNTHTKDFNGQPLISIPPDQQPYNPNNASYGDRQLDTWIVEPQANYKQTFGNGKLDVLLGSTIEQDNTNVTTLQGVGYSSDRVLGDISAASSIFAFEPTISTYKYSAVFGRANYILKDQYIIDLNIRRDGSSRFGVQRQFHNFESFGTGWIFSDQSFVQRYIPVISFGKLKASYGSTASDQIGDYTFLNLYTTQGVGVPYQNIVGLAPNGFSNPYLQWEETRKLQVGLDIGLLKDKILFYTSYSLNKSSNELLNYPLPSFTGFTSITENFPATVQNTSWEFSAETKNIKSKQITWTSQINFTVPRNKVTAFPNIALTSYASGFNGVIVGQPLGVIKGFHFLGVDPATGRYQYADSHGNPTFTPSFLTDRTALINTLPRLYGGLQNSVGYKGFQLDILVQFVKQIGRNVFFYNGVIFPGQFALNSNQPTTVLNHWQKPGDIAPVQKYTTNNVNYITISDYAFSDASYARIKNLSLSYQLPKPWRQKSHLQNCQIYLQGQNVLTITKFRGLDPENQSTTSLPPLRVWTMGLRFEL